MTLNKSLDHAIMLQETAQSTKTRAGYCVGDKVYENYLENETWAHFKAAMEADNPVAYTMFSKGGGKELEERKSGKYTYPPKMASFGSSSRMIYQLMKNTPGFLFEKKLPTTVGGIANLDGFMETDEKCVFVEAKCREPYTEKSGEIDTKYAPLYRSIQSLHCNIASMNGKKMQVDFVVANRPIQHFDIKQMICHLLGVATAYLNGTYNKPIDFIYLLYNPTMLHIENPTHKKAICEIYQCTCSECQRIDFQWLFYEILCYLQQEKKLGLGKNPRNIADQFSFRMCDQYTMQV